MLDPHSASGERTRDLYEVLPGYPKPPHVPLPRPGDIEPFEALGVEDTRATRVLMRVLSGVTGYSGFLRRPPEEIEALLRTVNLRGPALFAPPAAASVALVEDPEKRTAADRAASLVRAALDLRADVISGRLEPDLFGDSPCEMGQYPNLFGTNVVLGPEGPRLFKTARADSITVLLGGRFFIVNLGPDPGGPSFESLAATFDRILESDLAAEETTGLAPGVLACGREATQRSAFPLMAQDETNRASLETLRHSLFTVCLEPEARPASGGEILRQTHAGDWANRWHHASLQIVVCGNGEAGLICNFSAYLDGEVMMRAGAEIQRRGAALADGRGASESGEPGVLPTRPLQWNLEEEWLERARADVASILDPQRSTYSLEGLGRRSFRGIGGSAVPAFVASLQLALERLLPGGAPITQFLKMSRYRCMDLATGVVTTPAMRRFVESAQSGVDDPGKARAQLLEAVESQRLACREARGYLAADEVMSLYLSTLPTMGRTAVNLSVLGTLRSLKRFGLHTPVGRQVVISHPSIWPEVHMLGRPGVRLPYVKHLGLHYQVHDDRTTMTFMPAVSWQHANERVAEEIRRAMEEVSAIASATG